MLRCPLKTLSGAGGVTERWPDDSNGQIPVTIHSPCSGVSPSAACSGSTPPQTLEYNRYCSPCSGVSPSAACSGSTPPYAQGTRRSCLSAGGYAYRNAADGLGLQSEGDREGRAPIHHVPPPDRLRSGRTEPWTTRWPLQGKIRSEKHAAGPPRPLYLVRFT